MIPNQDQSRRLQATFVHYSIEPFWQATLQKALLNIESKNMDEPEQAGDLTRRLFEIYRYYRGA